MFRIIIFFAISVIIISCNKDEVSWADCTNPTSMMDKVKVMIPGRYNWIRTDVSYNRGGYTQTPQSQGKTMTYIFSANNNVTLIENNQTKWVMRYKVGFLSEVTQFPSDSITTIIITNPSTNQRIDWFLPSICSDSLLCSRPLSISTLSYFSRD